MKLGEVVPNTPLIKLHNKLSDGGFGCSSLDVDRHITWRSMCSGSNV
jgi:hypothetical protein